jgi:L-ascorbate metabolism protein UlaG (beta-lactamase superfamily)
MGKIDVILVPVGGFYTIDADEAGKVVKDLNPRITIPMHFKTPKCEFPIGGVELFTSGKKRVTVVNEHEIEVTKDGLPEDGEIIVMKYAL